MPSTELHKFVCWKTERVPSVINIEAVSVDAPTFLATHTPFHKITYLKTPAKLSSTSEEQLLDELRRRARAGQHTFSVIQGIPGSGKSHLIRWLKERYSADNAQTGAKDVVLLIERANNTLRQTLQQILESDAFDAAIFASQREKLARSTSQLTESGLEETLINNLQVAFVEDGAKGDISLKPNLHRRLNDFLLDSTVRSELRRVGGPIKRIARFLAADNTRSTDDMFPAFQPDDFDFKVDFLNRLRGEQVRQNTSDLVIQLNKEQARIDLAAYLNSLLEFAISRSTSLSSDDLKQMFNELRRELRRQKRGLALFIEDITAFTGLDTGLIDILITQHTGEGNKAFCRILSVVGVTDDYYNKRFPDNVRDRVSHHLTLNQPQSGVDTELLSSSSMVADLTSRYLNATRLSSDELQAWHADGADPARLPNACSSCPVHDTCHHAFGTVTISNEQGQKTEIGLYPFNASALWSMYSNIDTNVVLRTPRTLLNSIVKYVLESHTSLIQNGRFPPARNEVGSEFGAPTLLKPQQSNLFSVYNLTAQVRERIESLIVFWGDRTLDSSQIDGNALLGTLPKAVFEAFGLPFIDGQVISESSQSTVIDDKAINDLTGLQTSTSVSSVSAEDPIIRDIEDWRAGNQLQRYNSLGQALARFIRDTIDWDAHDVPRPLVEERVRQLHFHVQGQAGRSSSRYTLPLLRSDALANAFYAVHALEGNTSKLTPDELSSHLTALTTWLTQNEESFIRFVRAPELDAEDAPPLTVVQVQSVAALAALAGELNADSIRSPEQMAHRLIGFCAKPQKWENVVQDARQQRSAAWAALLRNPQIVKLGASTREGLLHSLNCPQGRSRSVIFVDMASLLDQIRDFNKADWNLAELSFTGEDDDWESVVTLHNVLVENFQNVLDEERARLQNFLDRLDAIIGGKSGQELDVAIKQFLEVLLIQANQQPPTALALDSKPSFRTMESTITILRNLVDEPHISAFAPRVSGVIEYSERVSRYVFYLEELNKYIEARMAAWQKALVDDDGANDKLTQTRATINSLYVSTAEKLAALTLQGDAQ